MNVTQSEKDTFVTWCERIRAHLTRSPKAKDPYDNYAEKIKACLENLKLETAHPGIIEENLKKIRQCCDEYAEICHQNMGTKNKDLPVLVNYRIVQLYLSLLAVLKLFDSNGADEKLTNRTKQYFEAAESGISVLLEDDPIRVMFPFIHSDYNYYVLGDLSSAVQILGTATLGLKLKEHKPASDIEMFTRKMEFYKSELKKLKGT